MKHLLHFAFFFFLSISILAQKTPADHAKSVITPALLKQSIAYLASDSMKGRATPSPALDAAGKYLADQLKSYGLQAIGGSYFQDLNYCYFDLGPDNFISVIKGLETINFNLKEDFVPYDISGNNPVEAEIVFAGYGITAPEFAYDDYKDLDIKGKIAVILRQEPGQTDSTSNYFEGQNLTRYASLSVKQQIAQDHGAVGLLVISGPLNFLSLKPRGYLWPSLSKTLPKDALPLDYCGHPESVIPMVHAGESIVNELFGNADSLKRIQQRIEQTKMPASFSFRGRTMAMNISIVSKPVGGKNVIAFIEGSDPVLKKEALVIGAHYDHVGCKKQQNENLDSIYNGADDNASGTSGMLAVARAFASMPQPPKRSVIFIAFAGEEKGLLGSASYVRKPLWPLDKTVAMLNLDMIGRNHPDSLEIIGARLCPDLAKIVRKRNKEIGFLLNESKSKYLDGGSDHASFFRKGIPALFFFTGLHEDYHQVTDSADLINADKAARVARLAFLTAWTISNERKHFKIVVPSSEDN